MAVFRFVLHEEIAATVRSVSEIENRVLLRSPK